MARPSVVTQFSLLAVPWSAPSGSFDGKVAASNAHVSSGGIVFTGTATAAVLADPAASTRIRRLGRSVAVTGLFYDYTLEQNIEDFGETLVGSHIRYGSRDLTILVQTRLADDRLSAPRIIRVTNPIPDMSSISPFDGTPFLRRGFNIQAGTISVVWNMYVPNDNDFSHFILTYGYDGIPEPSTFVITPSNQRSVFVTGLVPGAEVAVQITPVDLFGPGIPSQITICTARLTDLD